MSSHPSKKRRTHASSSKASIGAPSAALDSASALYGDDTPNMFASSTRCLPGHTYVPTLTTLCYRKFALNFRKLRENKMLWDERIETQLRNLPDEMVPKLFAALRRECGGYLDQVFIITYLHRESSITLTYSSLPGVKAQTLQRIAALNKGIQELEVSGFKNIKDNVFATALVQLRQLWKVILRGCTNVGTLTLQALTEHCPKLMIINLNYTSAPPAGIASLLMACPQMEVQESKAGFDFVLSFRIPKNATFQKFIATLQPNFSLPNLHALKLAHLALSDTALASLPPFSVLCPNLQHLDLSFTLVKNLPFLLSSSPSLSSSEVSPPELKLEKLNLTLMPITPAALEELLTLCPALKILALGALGGSSRGKGASASANGVGMMMDNAVLDLITRILSGEKDNVGEEEHGVATQRRVPVEDLSLVGNLKLGLMPRHDENDITALGWFIARVGRYCKHLNLSNLVHLHSSDLAGLMPPTPSSSEETIEEDTTSNLEILLLNNSPIDSSAAVYISTCRKLETLGLAGTRIDEEGLFTILDACPSLVNLDLTSCRSVKVVDRRRFFEVWEGRRRTEL